MNLTRMYGLFLRHFYLITRSFPRVLDLIYWPSIQITLWGFISNFFASHNMSEVERLCDSVLMMKDGTIIDKGTPKNLINKHGRDNLEEVFLKLTRNSNEL